MNHDEIATIRRLVRLRSGDTQESWGLSKDANALFDAHRGVLLAYCRKRLRDPERAEDIVNDVFHVAWRKLETYDFSSSFRGWLFGIARNTCRRANEKRSDVLMEDGILDPEDGGAIEAWRLAGRSWRYAMLQRAIASLPEQEQDAIYLRYFRGMDVVEVAEALGVSSAKGLLERCRRHLVKELRTLMADQGVRDSAMVSR